MKRAAVAELKRTAAAEVKVEEAKRAAAAAAEVEDTDEQGYFERISTFQGRNAEFVQTAASAVGAQENGHGPETLYFVSVYFMCPQHIIW